MKVKRVLVPLDGSTVGEAVLDRAAEFAHDEATLVLLRAAEVRSLVGDPVAAQVEVVHEAEVYLGGVVERLQRAGMTRVETCVWYGPAAEAIIEAAQVRNTDLILMSTHGRSGLSRLVLGSVAEAVLRGTRTPMLLIRPSGAPIAASTAGGARPAEVSHV
jgi:nucleotide-binding universal stress UspA family protein